MATELNPHVYPSGGFVFVDEDKVEHRGQDANELVAKVTEYRVRSAKPVGNVRFEVHTQICNRFPQGCRFIEETGTMPTVTAESPGHRDRFQVRVIKWLSDLFRAVSATKADLVPQNVAEERAAICVKCPNQADWGGNCAGCNASAYRLSYSLRRGRETRQNEKILGCAVLGEDTRTSVFIDGLAPIDSEKLPEFCWRKKK